MREHILKSFEDDIYNRKFIAENLTKIINSKSSSMVISLDSEWGTGKTTFVMMWKDLLERDPIYREKFTTFYFNAWENDYIQEPLLALFSEIESQINQKDVNLKQNLRSIKDVALPMIKFVARAGLKAATAGALDIDKVDLGEHTEDVIMNLATKLGDLSVQEVHASKKIINKFKYTMNQYQKESCKKIILFIDELDRCRPTFAIELLEIIKHIFDIDNIVFIISIDKVQLSHSIATIYGRDMDTLGYLRRFFDLDYKLPSLDKIKYIENKNSIFLKDTYNTELFSICLKEMFLLENFSLRDIDKAYYYIDLLIPLIKEFNDEYKNTSTYVVTISYLYAVLIALKIKKATIYNKIISCNYETDKILEEVHIPNINKYKNNILGWHPERLMNVIQQILPIYLDLNIETKQLESLSYLDYDKYLVGLRDENGDFFYSHKFSISYLFTNKEMNIKDKLEFLDDFEN